MFKRIFHQFKLIYFFGGVVLLVIFFSPDLIFSQGESSPRSPWKGREVFNEKGCIQCHQIFGRGGEDGPDLGENNFYGTYLDLAALMWNHMPEMIEKMEDTGYQIKHLNEEETEELIAYLSYIRYMGEPGNERTGRKLLKSKGCILCHKFAGVGGDVGPDISSKKEYLSPLLLVESMWNHYPEISKEKDFEHPVFKDNEIVDLAAGIRSYMSPTKVTASSSYMGNPTNGKGVSKKKGCMMCHSYNGIGGDFGPDFAEVELNYSVTQIAGKMWNHGPKMIEIMEKEGIPYPIFKPGEMADVIAYLYGLKLQDAPGDPKKGLTVINEGKCLSCHSINGKGATDAKDFIAGNGPSNPMSMIAAFWNHAPEMQKKFEEKNLDWPTFEGKDIVDLYAYLRTLSIAEENK